MVRFGAYFDTILPCFHLLHKNVQPIFVVPFHIVYSQAITWEYWKNDIVHFGAFGHVLLKFALNNDIQ